MVRYRVVVVMSEQRMGGEFYLGEGEGEEAQVCFPQHRRSEVRNHLHHSRGGLHVSLKKCGNRNFVPGQLMFVTVRMVDPSDDDVCYY